MEEIIKLRQMLQGVIPMDLEEADRLAFSGLEKWHEMLNRLKKANGLVKQIGDLIKE